MDVGMENTAEHKYSLSSGIKSQGTSIKTPLGESILYNVLDSLCYGNTTYGQIYNHFNLPMFMTNIVGNTKKNVKMLVLAKANKQLTSKTLSF